MEKKDPVGIITSGITYKLSQIKVIDNKDKDNFER